jgi:cytochrome c biogenesis protein CcmG/thiol:disulfide interchange protein DsbE
MKILLLISCWLMSLGSLAADLQLGKAAPEVQARLLDGSKTVQLSSSRGKVVIINFWATWCVPCKEEMPALQSYYERHKDQGLEVWAISMDEARDLPQVGRIAQQYSFMVAHKSQADFKELGRIWRMPTSFVVDKQGLLRKNGHVGEPTVDLALLEALVTPLLSAP